MPPSDSFTIVRGLTTIPGRFGPKETMDRLATEIQARELKVFARIVSDKVVSEVVIRTAAGIVRSIITTGSVERMNLKEGDNVFAVTKATSVSVEKD